MKNLLVLYFIMITSLFSQPNWNSVVPTNIPFSWGSQQEGKIDQFANKDGIHVFLISAHSSPTFRPLYYLINSSGDIVRNMQFEPSTATFPGIDGDDNKIYIVYKLDNSIKIKKSIDAGQNWSTNIPDILIGNNPCNNIDIMFSNHDNELHVVWAQNAGAGYKTFHRSLNSSDQWSTLVTVTDGSNVGGFPTVSTSNERVHVSYNTGNSISPFDNLGDAKSRDRYNSNWQTPQLVFAETSRRERIHAGSSKLFDFLYPVVSSGESETLLQAVSVSERGFNSTEWTTPFTLNYDVRVDDIVSAANTSDGRTHIVYPHPNHTVYHYYDTEWSDDINIGNSFISPKISGVSNDLFLVFGDHLIGGVKYRQYDVAPLAPQNLSVSQSQNNHPYFTWTANTELDINLYKIYRDAGSGSQYIGQTTNTYYEDVALSYCTATPPAACPENNYSYHIKAVDLELHESNPSNIVSVRLIGAQEKASINNPNSDFLGEYSLEQNYPNPFNPTTKIRYALQENAKVQIKVYDMLGTEVAELVNGTKTAGFYETTFDASNLSSGIYIYRITALNGERILFSESKRMILMK